MLAGGAMRAQGGPTTARELTTILGLGPHAAAGPYEGFPGLGVPVGTQWGEALDPTGTYLYASDSTNQTPAITWFGAIHRPRV